MGTGKRELVRGEGSTSGAAARRVAGLLCCRHSPLPHSSDGPTDDLMERVEEARKVVEDVQAIVMDKERAIRYVELDVPDR